MPNPAPDRVGQGLPKTLAGLAGLACVACCLLPALIAAGVVGAGASAVVGWLPAAAVALATLAAGTWWLRRRRGTCGCAGSGQDRCGCREAGEPQQVTIGTHR